MSKPEEDLITISGKDVEEVGFDKIRQQQAELQKLRIIVLDGCRIGRVEAGIEGGASRAEVIGQICPLCEQLDLSRNLFETWDEIAALISQLPHLTAVTLDGNRFQIRSTFERSEEIKSVRRLSLNECLLAWVDVGLGYYIFSKTLTVRPDNSHYARFEGCGRAIGKRKWFTRVDATPPAKYHHSAQPRGK